MMLLTRRCGGRPLLFFPWGLFFWRSEAWGCFLLEAATRGPTRAAASAWLGGRHPGPERLVGPTLGRRRVLWRTTTSPWPQEEQQEDDEIEFQWDHRAEARADDGTAGTRGGRRRRRGPDHLSAFLVPGDILAYQAGCWTVDGVTVGPDLMPSFHLAVLDTLQVVWTHHGEHGVLRGLALDLMEDNDNDDNNNNEQEQEPPDRDARMTSADAPSVPRRRRRQRLVLRTPEQWVEIGPEQLLARIPVDWNETLPAWIPRVYLYKELWEDHACP